jgi:hypothetical protein
VKLTVVAECLSLRPSEITRIWDSSELVAKGIPAIGSPEVPFGSVIMWQARQSCGLA